jgi:DNA-3-methyladenine glycosylase
VRTAGDSENRRRVDSRPTAVKAGKTSRAAKAPAAAKLRRLRRAELPADTVRLARYLIGKTLVHSTRRGVVASGRIVETEAYPPGDPSGHAFRGKTASNGSLFLERGFAYVYFAYGSSFMMNVSSERPGIGGGVLIRALEPLDSIGVMRRRRGGAPLRDLARGPGRTAAAMAIDRRCDGLDLCGKHSLWLAAATRRRDVLGVSPRIGITRAVDRPLRFYERGSRFVSRTSR